MADPDHTKTYVHESRTVERNGGNLALIVGGLVVAVGFVLWFMFGAVVPGGRAVPVSDDDTTVTIQPAAPATDGADPVLPDAEPVEPAPADPADGAAPAEPAPADE